MTVKTVTASTPVSPYKVNLARTNPEVNRQVRLIVQQLNNLIRSFNETVKWIDERDYLGDDTTTWPVASKTAAYTATADDRVILCDATSAAFTVTLPAAASSTGVVFYIKKIDSSANAVTIDGNGSETIDDATTQLLSSQYDCLTVHCDGTEWYII
jgi:hypothetical protein